MKKLWLLMLVFLQCQTLFAQSGATSGSVPQADPKAVITEGSARFTVLTPRLIRLEWSEKGTFTDDASFVVINRRLPLASFKKEQKEGWLVVTTGELELRYRIGSGKFNPQNLSIRSLDPHQAFTWVPGMTQTDNLKGTYRTLDGCDGDVHVYDKKKIQLEDGLLAKDGWSLIDDSRSFLFDRSDWPWVKERPEGDEQDWYFMGYGHQYKKALYDFSLVAGKIPLPPRFAFGYWWSRYWSYSDNEVRNVVTNFEKYNLPLDVFVIDMDWHYTDSLRGRKDEFGQPQQWTGWTWNQRLFPNPSHFMEWIKTKGLKTTLNLHPASGIAPYEAPYRKFAEKMGFDTTTRKNIPYIASDKKYMQTLFDVVLHPMEKMGVSFWWLDWQQWPNDKKIKNLSNTWWLNYTFFTDQERNSPGRPLLYHRWGGLGNHRYQIGFSGDATISWASLAYQPGFTTAASNVLYGYWSHDIGGHQWGPGAQKVINPELYVRWMQFGALSPIFRTHSTKSAEVDKDIWNFKGEYYDALSASIRFRYQMVPYIYTMARKAYDTALSLCRPLYYDYPDAPEAYANNSEYLFGDDLLVAPIVAPMANGEARLNVWLPGGNDWYEWNTGTLLKGGQTTERSFTLEEYPLYVKAGSVIPMYPSTVKNLNQEPAENVIGIFPGADGSANIYEDGGNSKNYATAYAITPVTSRHLTGRIQEVTILPRKGTYAGMAAKKAWTLKLYGAEMPEKITVNGKPVAYSTLAGTSDWSYNGKDLSITIPVASAPCNLKQVVQIYYSKKEQFDVNTGLVKRFRELTKATSALKFKDAGIILPEAVGRCEETNLRLSYDPGRYYETLRYFETNYPKIPEAIRKATRPENAEWYIETLKLK